MRWIVAVGSVLWVGLATSSASAGRVFGDIEFEGKPAPAGFTMKIAIAPPARTPGAEATPAPLVADSTVTDKFGSYKLTVKETGKCMLTLVYEKQAITLEVFSYKEAIRYDLILEQKDGQLSLRRK